MATALDKSILYFYPIYLRHEFKSDDLPPDEKEIINHFRQIYNKDLQNAAIKQVKVLSEFDPKETLLNALDFVKNEFEVRQQLKEFFDKKKKR